MQFDLTAPSRVSVTTPSPATSIVQPFNTPTAADFDRILAALNSTQGPPSAAAAAPATASFSGLATPPATGQALPSTAAATTTLPTTGTATTATQPQTAAPADSLATAQASHGAGCVCSTCSATGGMGAPMGYAVLLLPINGASGYSALSTVLAALGGSMAAANGATLATSGLNVTGAVPSSLGRTSLALPFQGAHTITQPFGPTSYAAEPAYAGYSHFHTGIDFGLPLDTAVKAAGPGRVVASSWDSTGFGNRVIIDHGNGLQTLYGHLDSLTVSPGDTVQAGQEIGLSGSTGNSSGPHLHFGVQKDGQWIDPSPYLGLQPTTTVATAAPPATQAVGGGNTLSGAVSPLGVPGSVAATAAATASSPLQPAAGSGTALPGTVSPLGAPGSTAATAYATRLAPQDLKGIVSRVSAATGVSASLISAVVQAESSGNPQAVSPAGAKGLMQLLDSTAAQFGVTNLMDPTQNVLAGSLYLRSLLQHYGGNAQLAIAAYNAGPGTVDRFGGVPPYPETQNYVARVTALQHHFAAESGS